MPVDMRIEYDVPGTLALLQGRGKLYFPWIIVSRPETVQYSYCFDGYPNIFPESDDLATLPHFSIY